MANIVYHFIQFRRDRNFQKFTRLGKKKAATSVAKGKSLFFVFTVLFMEILFNALFEVVQGVGASSSSSSVAPGLLSQASSINVSFI